MFTSGRHSGILSILQASVHEHCMISLHTSHACICYVWSCCYCYAIRTSSTLRKDDPQIIPLTYGAFREPLWELLLYTGTQQVYDWSGIRLDSGACELHGPVRGAFLWTLLTLEWNTISAWFIDVLSYSHLLAVQGFACSEWHVKLPLILSSSSLDWNSCINRARWLIVYTHCSLRKLLFMYIRLAHAVWRSWIAQFGNV